MRPHSIVVLMSDVKPFGGAEHSISLMVRRLDRSVFAPRLMVPREGPVVDEIRDAGIPVHVLALTRARDLTRFPEFVSLLKTHRVGLVNAHGVRGGFYAALASRVMPLKVVVCERNLQPWRARVLPRALDRFVGRHNDFRIGVSQAIVDDMVEAGVIPRAKTQVLVGGVDPGPFVADAQRRSRARAAFGLGDNEPSIVATGRLHRMKGFIDLVEAAPHIVRSIPGVRIIIAGEGEERAALEKRIHELDLDRVIHLPGFLRDMPELLAAADLFVLPSASLKGVQREGTPIAILEAQAAGLAVVTTRVSGNAEIIRDGFNGRVVPPQEPVQLASAIVEMLNSPARREMGENGRRLVHERYSIDRVVESYTRIFLQLLESDAGTGPRP
jgi:glycosyltransferase involved in cell wall biosynthesis